MIPFLTIAAREIATTLLAALICAFWFLPIFFICALPFIIYAYRQKRREEAAMAELENTEAPAPETSGLSVAAVRHVLSSRTTDLRLFASEVSDPRIRATLLCASKLYMDLLSAAESAEMRDGEFADNIMRTVEDYLRIKGVAHAPEVITFRELLRGDCDIRRGG